MSAQLSNFSPEFFVDETSGRALRVGLVLPPSKDFRARMKYADIVLPEAGVVEARVLAAAPADDKQPTFLVQLCISGLAAPLEIGILTYIGNDAEKLKSATEAESFAEDLTAVVQQAFFAALRGDRAPAAFVPRVAHTAAAGSRPAREWRRAILNWRSAAAVVVVVGVGSIAFGAYQAMKPQDPLQKALASDDFKDIQERIRRQISAAGKGEGAFNALQGQNVAIDTMRAMGLDPGKANTGCLVGVK